MKNNFFFNFFSAYKLLDHKTFAFVVIMMNACVCVCVCSACDIYDAKNFLMVEKKQTKLQH